MSFLPCSGFNHWLFKGPPVNRAPFFALYIKEENKKGQAVLLKEPPTNLDYEGDLDAVATNHGLPGFHYSGVEKSRRFMSKPGTYFRSNGYSWGTCRVTAYAATEKVFYG